jgi:hypothetical protein
LFAKRKEQTRPNVPSVRAGKRAADFDAGPVLGWIFLCRNRRLETELPRTLSVQHHAKRSESFCWTPNADRGNQVRFWQLFFAKKIRRGFRKFKPIAEISSALFFANLRIMRCKKLQAKNMAPAVFTKRSRITGDKLLESHERKSKRSDFISSMFKPVVLRLVRQIRILKTKSLLLPLVMTKEKLPEVWLRGPIENIQSLLQPVAHACCR